MAQRAAQQRRAGDRGPAVPDPVREADLGPAVGGLLLTTAEQCAEWPVADPAAARSRGDAAGVGQPQKDLGSVGRAACSEPPSALSGRVMTSRFTELTVDCHDPE